MEQEQRKLPRQSVAINFVQALAAVLLGNAAYLLLSPYLPVRARHQAFKFDLGMLVDFWFCLAAFGLIKTARSWSRKRREREG
jgi:hypothetical protein